VEILIPNLIGPIIRIYVILYNLESFLFVYKEKYSFTLNKQINFDCKSSSSSRCPLLRFMCTASRGLCSLAWRPIPSVQSGRGSQRPHRLRRPLLTQQPSLSTSGQRCIQVKFLLQFNLSSFSTRLYF